MNKEASYTLREKDMYNSLLNGFIHDDCCLEKLGIKVENNKIVTPGVKFLYQDNDKRHITIFLNDNRVGSIFYKEKENDIVFYVYNNNYK